MIMRTNYGTFAFFLMFFVAVLGATVFWLFGEELFEERSSYRIEFSRAIAGLSVGSNVSMLGVSIGRVTDISLRHSDRSTVVVTASLSRDVVVKQDASVSIRSQGVTGLSTIEISAGTPSSQAIVPIEMGGQGVIVATSSGGDPISSAANTLASAERTFNNLEGLIIDNQSRINSIVQLTEQLIINSNSTLKDIPQAIQNMSDASQSISKVADTIQQSIDLAGGPQVLANTLLDVSSGAQNIKIITEDFAQVSGRAIDIADQLQIVSNDLAVFSNTLAGLSELVDAGRIATSLDDFAVFSGALADTAPKIDEITARVVDVLQLTTESMASINSMLADGDDAIDTERISTLLNDIEIAVKEVTIAARVFSVQVDSISNTFADVSDTTGEAIDTVAQEAMVAIDRLTDFIDMIKDEPSQLLFGQDRARSFEN